MSNDRQHRTPKHGTSRGQPQPINSGTYMPNNAINLSEKLSMFNEHWSPRTVGTFNDHDLMVVKVKGEFVWHTHADTDDFFLVLKGTLKIEMRDRTVTLNAGEMYVVPKGIEHRTVADDEAHLLLIEPTGTPNTGSTETAAVRTLA
jgi:mannose-6-phosphate isomerase-like protein (cupin superfamily)